MNRLKVILSTLLFLAFATLCASTVQAGGQLVSLYADNDGWINSMYGRVIRVYINPAFPCKGTQITFKFVESKDGDYVTTGSGSPTYTMSEDRNSSGCTTYAKMGTKNSEARMITVDVRNGDNVWSSPPVIKVHFDGQHHLDDQTNDESYRSSTNDPYSGSVVNPTSYPVPTGDLKVWLISQERVPPYGRNVTVKWETDEGDYDYYYDVYVRTADSSEWNKMKEYEEGPSATLNLRADKDYSIKVKGCIKKVGTCIDSNELSLLKLKSSETVVTKKVTGTLSTSYATDESNQKVEALNKKVDALQDQLAASQKKQNILEQRIDELIAFIKNLLPFLNKK